MDEADVPDGCLNLVRFSPQRQRFLVPSIAHH
jgi:hypothetical protein